MLQGQHQVKVGEKFRVAFPGTYRTALGSAIILTYGFEKSLIAASENHWNAIVSKEIDSQSFLAEHVRDLRRFFLGGITYLEFDAQGRFVLPEYLRNYAEIAVGGSVTFIWQREYIEIWDTRRWEERQKTLFNTIGSIAEKLSRTEGK